ncbi:MAG: class I SAM-dependent methyltransferase [Candidatus Omnitrophota bacterium]
MSIDTLKKAMAKRYFDRWAMSYDKSILQHLIFRASHEMFIKEISVINSARFKVLDIGCGTGELAKKLSSRFKNANVNGVDISETMIEKASAKNMDKAVSFRVGDVEKLPYKENSFDVLTCSHSFHHYPNKDKALSEMHRVLKPNGHLMIIDGSRDVFLGRIIFDIVTMVEKHVYHLFHGEFREIFAKNGFGDVMQKRFNLVPQLLTVGRAFKA